MHNITRQIDLECGELYATYNMDERSVTSLLSVDCFWVHDALVDTKNALSDKLRHTTFAMIARGVSLDAPRLPRCARKLIVCLSRFYNSTWPAMVHAGLHTNLCYLSTRTTVELLYPFEEHSIQKAAARLQCRI